jgi:hypothetical protein
MYPYHVQPVQDVGPGDFARRLEFCKWLNGSGRLHRYSLFTDKAQFNHDGVNNTMCGQMRIPMPLWKAAFSYVSVSVCGVQFWMIS